MGRNNSSTQLNAIFHALGIPQHRVKDCYNADLLVYAGQSPFDLIKLDLLLQEYELYDWKKYSMQWYIQKKLSPELEKHFNILFLHVDHL